MFLSVTHRILGPIVFLLLLGVLTTAWTLYGAIKTHDDMQAEEKIAYMIVANVEQAQKTHGQLNQFLNKVLSLDEVIPHNELKDRYGVLQKTLAVEIISIKSIAEAPSVAKAVSAFEVAAFIWDADAKIALGFTSGRVVPTKQRLNGLAEMTEQKLADIYTTARSEALQRTALANEEYLSRVVLQFLFMLGIFTSIGVLFLLFGRRFAASLRQVSVAMEQILNGDYKQGLEFGNRRDEVGQIARGVQAFGRSLQELTEANEQVKHLAMHDQLTGLPNRRTLQEHLDHALKNQGNEGGNVAILHVDLDRFKQVNDMYGHAAGDKVLQHATAAMQAQSRKADLVARVGGDEFAIVLLGVETTSDAEAFAQRMIEAISTPIDVWHDMTSVGASIGIAFANETTDAERLLANADIALYMAKGAGRGTFAFYTDETRRHFDSQMLRLRELRSGLDRQEIIAHFQPQVDVSTHSIVGFEALARWQHPEHGLLGPGEFIDLAFEHGLGDRISKIIVDEAVKALVGWRRSGLEVPCVSVNFSAGQLRDNELPEYLDDVLFTAGLAPEDLTIEVLESVFFGDEVDPAHTTIARLKERGYRIELDDFGTGHASISNLRQFKVDSVKIDRVFVADVDKDAEQEMILRTLIDLCRNLGIECLAEGVETEFEQSKLLALGCSRFQGFGLARPMPPQNVALWMDEFHMQTMQPKLIKR